MTYPSTQNRGSSHSYSSLPVISPSSVSDLDCSKKFWVTRVLHQWPPRPETPALTAAEFGTAFHAVMSSLYRGVCQPKGNHYEEHPCPSEEVGGAWIPLPVFSPDTHSLPDLRHLSALTRAAFHARRYPSAAGRDEDIQTCMDMVQTYVQNEDEEDVTGTLAVERWGEFVIEDGGQPLFRLCAKLDRVLVRGAEPDCLVVRDYKTSLSRRVSLVEAFVVLWGARLCYPGYGRYALEYERVDKEGRVDREVVRGEDVRGQHGWLLSRLHHILGAGDHPAEPGDGCRFCVLRPSCQPLMLASSETGGRRGTER